MALKIKDYADTTYVTGMRAWAALAVVLIHAGGAGLRSFGALGNLFVDLGRGGVYAFFVISGFSVAASYPHSGGFRRYLYLRFFRIAPLYYFWVLAFALIFGHGNYWAQTLGAPAWPVDLALHALFLHGFFVHSANSIVGVEWSLSVELFWYVCLPFFFRLTRRAKGLPLFVVGVLAYVLWHVFMQRLARTDARASLVLLWHPFSYCLSFLLGVWAHRLREDVQPTERTPGSALGIAALGLYLLASTARRGFILDPVLSLSFVTFFLLVYGSNSVALCRWLFMPRWILGLGTLSYGIYLAHRLPIVFFERFQVPGQNGSLYFLSVSVLSTALAWAAYRWIEQPAQAWSKRFWPLVNKSAKSVPKRRKKK